jgi:hypothetical protein
MSEPTSNDQPAYVEPKALTPYRHKLQQSGIAVAAAMRGRPDMSQAKQVRMLQAVVAELRKMSAGAQKALEIAQGRDYDAYLAAKKAVKEGKLTEAEQAEFDALVQGLTAGDSYEFTADEVDPDDEAAMAKLADAEQGDEDSPTEG